MTDQKDIEQIVREVLARLNDSRETQGIGEKKQSVQANDRLELKEKLVTLATLENRLAGVQTLVLPRGSVVTPAARDLLRERGVRVSHVVRAAKQSLTLMLGVADEANGAKLALAALSETLVREGVTIERVASTGLASVVAELADQAARGGRPALALTSQPEAAVCLANRQRGVRAVALRDVSHAKSAIVAVAANFLAVDAAMTTGALGRLVHEFCAGWPRPAPAIFDVELRSK